MSRLPNSEPLSIPLPRPWKHAGIVHRDNRIELEQATGLVLDKEDAALARWDELINEETGIRALIRVHLPEASAAETRISAVLFASLREDGELRATALRDFPLAAISQGYVNYEYRAMHSLNSALMHEEDFDPAQSIGRPKRGDTRFYVHLALQYLNFEEHLADPTQAIADLSGVPRGTVKRWLAEARKQGLLPPGKRGRIAKGTGNAQD